MLSMQRVKAYTLMEHMRIGARALSLLMVLTTPVSAQNPEQPLRSGQPVHYLVIEADAQGGLQVVHHQQVLMAMPLESLSDQELTTRASRPTTRQNDAVTVQVFDAAGRRVFQTVAEVPRWLRGEFLIDENDPAVQADDSNIAGHHFALEQRSFVVRVPVTGPGAILQVQPTFTAARTPAIDLDGVVRQFAALQPAAAGVVEFVPGRNMGPSDNRLDILILGDGYQSTEENQFKADTEMLINNFMAIRPYEDYANYVNVRRVFTISQQSGADRPTCPDPGAGSNDDNTFVNTAFDATFCTSNIWRLLTVNTSKVLTAAAAAPNWDKILVLVNTPLYGGAGGSLAVGSLHTQAVEIMQHEFGHAFTRLADEYTSPFPGFPACSDTNASTADNCEANVTNQTTRNLIKWNRWIDAATPIPTLGPLPDPQAAGLWEGARYQTTGMFRQGFDCLMKSLGTEFCTVDSEAYALRLYRGGWGNPSLGIKNFEQLSPANSIVLVNFGQTRIFSARVLGPINGPDVTLRWLLDGVVVRQGSRANGTLTSYTFGPRPSGNYTLTLEVTDHSPIIHNTVRPVSRRIWDVEVRESCPRC